MKLQLSRLVSLLLLTIVVCTSFKPDNTITIKGKIIQSQNNKAVEKAYVYIISGEEETLSLADGQFSIRTWQKFPITVVVEHADYLPTKTLLKKNDREILISLQKK